MDGVVRIRVPGGPDFPAGRGLDESEAAMSPNDIYAVYYKCSNGDVLLATVPSHCRIAAINDIVIEESRHGRGVVCASAELMCPSRLLHRESTRNNRKTHGDSP